VTFIRMNGCMFYSGADFERFVARWAKAMRTGHFMRLSCEGVVVWLNPRQIVYAEQVRDRPHLHVR
jgi:hypothetical protein